MATVNVVVMLGGGGESKPQAELCGGVGAQTLFWPPSLVTGSGYMMESFENPFNFVFLGHLKL